MNHSWKMTSLSELIRYNKWLLASVVILSMLCLVLGFAYTSREEKWILIPCSDIDHKIEVGNNKLYPSYLKSWATYIAKEIFTTSPEEIHQQHNQIRRISDKNKELTKFFEKQLQFVTGNRASTVFHIKDAEPIDGGGVRVTGTLNYWFGDKGDKIALEKTYLIYYREAARGLVLLTQIKEEKERENND